MAKKALAEREQYAAQVQAGEKKKRTPEEKKRRRRIVGRVLLGILAAIVLFMCVTVVITLIGNAANTKKARSFETVSYPENRLVPELDEHGNYFFTTKREFKVLQLTDVHIGGGWMSLKKDAMALNAVAAMVTAEKPDLVIVTGDIGYPVPFQAGTFNNKASAKIFAALMEQLGVYWTLTFGNHDTEAYSYFDRADMAKFYENDKYEYCLFLTGPEDVDGYGNQIINVKDPSGEITQSLYLFDSHSYTDGDYFGIFWKYDNIHPNQIAWYKENVEMYNAENQKIRPGASTVRSAAFFHIPLREFKEAWEEYVDNGFKDTDMVKYEFGTAGETGKVVYCGMGEDELFETFLELGSTQGVFCGHDHLNNFSLEYHGVRLTYGMSVDYLAYPGIYKKGTQRGCTVISFAPDGSMTVTPESYYQDKYVSRFEKEPVTMQEITPITDIKE